MDQKKSFFQRLLARFKKNPNDRFDGTNGNGYQPKAGASGRISPPPAPKQVRADPDMTAAIGAYTSNQVKPPLPYEKLYADLKKLNEGPAEPWYVIRFIDPSKEPEEVEEGVEEPWTRFYCEADLVRSIEAAESFDTMESAIAVSQILVNAKIDKHEMLELPPEVFLKMRLIGQARIDMSEEYVPLVFDDTMIIQVIKVTEHEVGYHSEVFWQDNYKWVWFQASDDDDESPADEDHSDHEPDEYPVDMRPYR